MKKFVYCLLPLIALQLDSCVSTKVLSRDALPKNPIDLTEVTGFKNKITYKDGVINDTTSVTYDNNLPIVSNRMEVTKKSRMFMASNIITENEYNEDGLLKSEKKTACSISGGISEIKEQEIHDLEYDNYKNCTKNTTTKRRYSEGEVVKESVEKNETKYTYDKNDKLTNCVEEHINPDGEINYKKNIDYTYDEKQRLTKAEAKVWNNNYDDPEGYNKILKATHSYEGNKITDINETLLKIEGTFKTTEKIMQISEYDSKYNLTHELSYNYDLENPLLTATAENFYEYNSEGLETYFRSYKTSSAESPISQFEYRITTYCGSNNDKLKSRIFVSERVNKFSRFNSEKASHKNIRNYYDNEQRVIRQEISEDGTGTKPTQSTYLFEY